MAWYLTLFDCVYKSSIGTKILAAIELSARSGNLEGAFLCYLAVRKFERVAVSGFGDTDLSIAIGGVLAALESIGSPLDEQELHDLKQIFEENGFLWISGDSFNHRRRK